MKRDQNNICETNVTSVKVHHAPGGQSSFSLAWDTPQQPAKKPTVQKPTEQPVQPPAQKPTAPKAEEPQAAGTAKTSVKVHNPPGGKSSITFG